MKYAFLVLLIGSPLVAMNPSESQIAAMNLDFNKTAGDPAEADINLEILRQAIYKGDVKEVKSALGNIPDINACTSNTMETPLHFVFHTVTIHGDILALILSRGASETAKNRAGNTPLVALRKRLLNSELFNAIDNFENPERISQLLDNGAHPSTRYKFTSTGKITSNHDYLYHAFTIRNFKAARLLINAGANATIVYDETGDTPLHMLYRNAKGDDLTSLSELLVQKGASFETKNKLGQTPKECIPGSTLSAITSFLKAPFTKKDT